MCVIVSAPAILPYILAVPTDAVYTGDSVSNGRLISAWQVRTIGETESYFFDNATSTLVQILIGSEKQYTQLDYVGLYVGPTPNQYFSIPSGLNCSKAMVDGKHITKEELEKHLTMTPKFSTLQPAPKKEGNHTAEKRIDPATVIAVGKQVWQIIVDNKPVVDVNTPYNGVIPQGATFTDLAGWRQSMWQPWQWHWTNLYGVTVVDYQWSFDWNCNGNYRGVGHYIQNAGAFPKSINVAWGYKVSVDAQMLQPSNIGTHDNPIAATTFYMTMKINTVIKSSSQSCKVVLQGDCGNILIFCDQYSK